MDDREREEILTRARNIISVAFIRTVGRFPFFAYLLHSLPVVPSWDVLTADVDGRQIRYNPAFVAGLYDALGPDGVVWLLAHEVLHPALGHLWRGERFDQERWNIACDVVVNELLAEVGLPVPHDCVRASDAGIDRFDFQLSEEEIYHLLASAGSTSNSKGRPGRDIVRPSQGEHRNVDGTLQDVPSRHEWATRLRRAAEYARQRQQGKLPAGLLRAFGLDEPSRVDWRSVVERYITLARNDYSWQAFDRRMLQYGVYFPDLRSEQVVVVAAVDTSGSIKKEQLSAFVSEVVAFSRTVPGVWGYVVTCDAAVRDVVPFDELNPANFKPRGGGGTDFRPVFEWVESVGLQPAVLVYLTDGDGEFPAEAPPYPVVWVIHRTDGEHPSVPFGEVVRYPVYPGGKP